MFENRKKNKRIAFWGTFIFAGIVAALLIFFGFSTPLPLPEEEGILVNFGYDASGSGAIETGREPVQEEVSSPEPATPPEEKTNGEEQLMTQDFEEAPAVETKKETTQKEKEKKREQEKKRRKELRRQRELEEKRRKETEEKQKINELTKNAFSKGKNADSNAKSDGDQGGKGNQGDTEGDPDAKQYGEGKGLGDKGIGYSLKGRTPQGGKLPKPVYTTNESGIVVVRVTVDRNGNVTSANYRAKGSTTTNQRLIKAALKAARKAKFNQDTDADAFQVGTISYRFVLQ